MFLWFVLYEKGVRVCVLLVLDMLAYCFEQTLFSTLNFQFVGRGMRSC